MWYQFQPIKYMSVQVCMYILCNIMIQRLWSLSEGSEQVHSKFLTYLARIGPNIIQNGLIHTVQNPICKGQHRSNAHTASVSYPSPPSTIYGVILAQHFCVIPRPQMCIALLIPCGKD